MAGQGSEDKIAEILKQAYPSAVASPEFKEKLLQRLSAEAGAPAAPASQTLWQQPFVWATAGVAAAIAIALVLYFVVFQPAPLAVTTIDATSIQADAATLNAKLDGLGADDSVEVSFEWGTTKEYSNETTPEVRTEDGTITATLSDLAPGTTYHFRVKMVGPHGTVYGPDKEFTTGTPPSVITNDASKIGASSARLNGKLSSPGTAESATVSFVWGTTAGGPYTETTPEEKGTGAFSFDLDGLPAGTIYYYRAKAVSDGASVYGEEKSFTTLIAPPLVVTDNANSVVTTSARLNANLTSLGTATSVSVSFQWDTTSGSYANETTTEVRNTAGAFFFDLGSLTPGTTYYFRAKAVGDGISYGSENSFTTLTTPPSATTNDSTSVATTSATLNGNLTSLGTAGSVNVSFEYGTATGSYTHTTTNQAMISTGVFSADLSGLTLGTTYYFRAKAMGDGTSYGAEVSFTTLTIPPSVTTSSATGVHSTSATLNGNLDSLGTAVSVTVYFEWGTSVEYGNQTEVRAKTSAGNFSASLINLGQNTTYHFRAKAIGDGVAYGADMEFTTGSTPPPQKTWYLSKQVSGSVDVMYEGDTSKPDGTVKLGGDSPYARIWRADLPSDGATYTAGTWTVSLTLSHINSNHQVDVEIGTFNGADFTSYGSQSFMGGDNGVYAVDVSVGSFTVPPGGYVATRIRVNEDYVLNVGVGDSQSYVRSPLYSESSAHSLASDASSDDVCPSAAVNGGPCSAGSAGIDMGRSEWRFAGGRWQWDCIAAPGCGCHHDPRPHRLGPA